MTTRWIRACAALLVMWVLGCGGKEGPPGPAGPAGPAGPGALSGPSISGITPSRVVAGQEYDVIIEGFATDWTDTAKPDFGQNISVTTTQAASGTSLLVHIKVSPDAKADVHDVSVTQGAATTYWRNAFMVIDRVAFTSFGVATPLSASVVRLEVNDPQFEFDTSSGFDGFTGVTVTASPDFPLQVLNISQKVLDMLVLADVDAGTGAYDISVVSRPGTLAERTFTKSQVFTVVPGDPMPFSGGPVSATVVAQVSSSSPNISPRVAVIPASGLWADYTPFAVSTTLNVLPGDSFYLVVWESTGATGFSYTLTSTVLTPTAEEEPNDTPADAKPMAVPGLVDAQFSALEDVDYYKVTVGPGDVGKRFHVITQPGDDQVDSIVDIYETDGVTSFGESSDTGYEEDFLSNPIPSAGDYFIKISQSPDVSTWDVSESHYEVFVTIE